MHLQTKFFEKTGSMTESYSVMNHLKSLSSILVAMCRLEIVNEKELGALNFQDCVPTVLLTPSSGVRVQKLYLPDGRIDGRSSASTLPPDSPANVTCLLQHSPIQPMHGVLHRAASALASTCQKTRNYLLAHTCGLCLREAKYYACAGMVSQQCYRQ